MKKSKNYVIPALLIPFVIAIAFEWATSCTPKKYPCIEEPYYIVRLYDSVFTIESSCGRIVDSVYYKDAPKLDSIFLKDNL